MNENEKNINLSDSHKKPFRLRYVISAVILLLIIAALIFSFFNWKQKPDPASEKIIREAVAAQLNKDPNKLTNDDFAKITDFQLIGREISDLKLLKKFTNLQQLNLSWIQYPENKLPIWLKILEKLDIDNDPAKKYMIDLNPIKKLTKLKRLVLTCTPFKDINTITSLKNLESLELGSTQVSDLKPIKKLTNLIFLDIRVTEVSNLEPIKYLKNLQSLTLDGTPVLSIEPLKGLTKLQKLSLSWTQIDDLEHIKSLTGLQELNISDCNNISNEQVEDLQKALPELKIIESRTLFDL